MLLEKADEKDNTANYNKEKYLFGGYKISNQQLKDQINSNSFYIRFALDSSRGSWVCRNYF